MGIRGLPKALRESGPIAGHSCKDAKKPTHVDFLALFFRLLQSKAFQILQRDVKACSNSATSTPVPELQLETEVTAGSRKRKNVAEYSPSSIDRPIRFAPEQTVAESIEDAITRFGHGSLFLSPDGLSSVETKSDQQTFRAIGYVLDGVLSNKFNKDLTTLHVDGLASEQKRQEHQKRNQSLKKSIDSLKSKVDSPATKPRKQLFRTCRNLYRLPRHILCHDVLSVLEELGWPVHYCTHQADTCLAGVCQDNASDSIIIVTSDSDLMVYEGVQSLMMPVGRSRELMMFDKRKLLQHLGLKSEQHLLLACVVTSNDYVNNIPYFGLLTNCEVIRDIDLSALGPLGASASNADRANAIMPFIQLYLDGVKDRLKQRKVKSKHQSATRGEVPVQADYYFHSVTAFVARIETSVIEPLQPDDESPCSHETITTIIQELYSRKSQQQQLRQSKSGTNTLTQHPPSDRVSTNERSDMVTDTNIESALPSTSVRKRRRSQKRQQHRKHRFEVKLSEDKHMQWRESQFKSRTDNQQRYAIRSVNILSALSVEESELLKMTIPEPRVKKAQATDSNDNNRSTASSSNKQKRTTEPQPKKKKHRKPRKAKSDVVSLKSGFAKSFAASTQTLGSVQGCLRRALLPASECGRIPRLSEGDIKAIANRIEAAVITMAEARMHVCRMVDIMVYDELLRNKPKASADVFEEHGEPFDILDLLLDKSAGTVIIKYLFSLVLNGKIDGRGPKTEKEKTKAAKKMAQSTFKRLEEILPGFRPVNRDLMPLGRLVVDAAAEFS
ncbi:hypothetical protein BGZ99_002100, partial [Dissophora globulifera]